MVKVSTKVPRTPPALLGMRPSDVRQVVASQTLWRVHRTTGSHVVAWNQFRMDGPVAGMRWEPHPLPPGQHTIGVMDTALTPATALAEVGQAHRTVDTLSGHPYLTSWSPTRTLELLDLTGTWPVRNSAAHALISAPRPVCQAWARAIAAQFPALDGLWVDSTITGDPNVVLWSSAANAMPTTPNWSRTLADPAFRPVVAAIARTDLGYAVI